jgi:hypothetical protein
MGVKEANADLKVLFCVGGTEFPSHSWSAMAASADSRATFITSVQTMSTTYGFDGVELHWVRSNACPYIHFETAPLSTSPLLFLLFLLFQPSSFLPPSTACITD